MSPGPPAAQDMPAGPFESYDSAKSDEPKGWKRWKPTRFLRRDAWAWSLDIPGVVAWAGAAALLDRGAPKAHIITALPSGLGTQTADAKALKARSIGLAGTML